MTRNGTLQPPRSANMATAGTPLPEDKVVNAINIPTTRARRSGGVASAMAAMPLGGIMPAPSPVDILAAINNSRLGANADAKTPVASSDNPVSATGRLPSESDRGPTQNKDTPQAANVAVATCPEIDTDVSNSAAISTSNGANISAEAWVEKNAKATAAKKRVWFRGWSVSSWMDSEAQNDQGSEFIQSSKDLQVNQRDVEAARIDTK